MTISSTSNPTGYLTTPTGSTDDFMWEVRANAGALVGMVDTVLHLLINFSPLEEWIVKPLGGGWDSVDKAGQAWSNLGKAAKVTAESIDGVSSQVGDRWEGEAAEEWSKANAKVADRLAGFPEGCEALAEACASLAELAKLAASTAASIIGELVDLVLEIAAILATVYGSPAAEAPIAELGGKIPRWVKEVADAIQDILDVIDRIKKISGPLLNIANDLAQLAAAKETATSSVTSSTRRANDAFAA